MFGICYPPSFLFAATSCLKPLFSWKYIPVGCEFTLILKKKVAVAPFRRVSAFLQDLRLRGSCQSDLYSLQTIRGALTAWKRIAVLTTTFALDVDYGLSGIPKHPGCILRTAILRNPRGCKETDTTSKLCSFTNWLTAGNTPYAKP